MKSLLLKTVFPVVKPVHVPDVTTQSTSGSDFNPLIALAVIAAVIAIVVLFCYCGWLYEKYFLIPRGKMFTRSDKNIFKIVPYNPKQVA